MSDVSRRDFFVKTDDGVSIAIREVRQEGNTSRVPLIMLHGTRIPGLSEFDLNVPGGSWAEDMAKKGHVCYIVDARSFGRSERPPEMDEPPVSGAPALVRTIHMTRDVEAAVDHLRDATGVDKVGLIGWGVGGTCVFMYAALRPEKVSHVAMYCGIYGRGRDPMKPGGMGRGSKWDDPDNPGQFNRKAFGNYTYNTLDLLEEHWDTQIPIEDKNAWRDPEMVKAFSQALLDGDPTSMQRNPPSYRSANGMLEDLFHMANGRILFNANQIYCKAMIINPELDGLAQDEDMDALVEDLVHAEDITVWADKNTTHYVILERPERGRDSLMAALDKFLR